MTVGGSDLIKTALKGNVRFADYQFVLAHPDIMPEMLALRGLLKRKFPSAKSETLGVDMYEMVKKFMNGLFVQGKRDEFQENFGSVNIGIGTVCESAARLNGDMQFIVFSLFFFHCLELAGYAN